MTSLIRCGAITALALLAAGCAGDHTDLAPRLGVEAMTRIYDVPVERCGRAAPGVRQFVAAMADGHPESVRVSIEGGRGACATAIARATAEVGVAPSQIRVAAEASPGRARIRLERLVVSHVDCHLSDGFNRGVFTDNGFDPALGCSTRLAVGAMAADPEDLAVGKGRVRAEGEPAASAVAAARQVHDSRTTNESESHHQDSKATE